MKILFLLLIPFILLAQNPYDGSDATFIWNWEDSLTVEYSAGDDTPTWNGEAKMNGTIKVAGDSSMYCPVDNDYVTFSVTSNDIGDGDVGAVQLAYYMVQEINTDVVVFRLYENIINDAITIFLRNGFTGNGDVDFRIRYEGNDIIVEKDIDSNLDDDTWYWIRATWEVGGTPTLTFKIYSNNNGEPGALLINESWSDALTAFDDDPTTLYIGTAAYDATVYYDNFSLYKTASPTLWSGETSEEDKQIFPIFKTFKRFK